MAGDMIWDMPDLWGSNVSGQMTTGSRRADSRVTSAQEQTGVQHGKHLGVAHAVLAPQVGQRDTNVVG